MNHRNQTHSDWDDSVYGTGPTQPPKSRGGLVALLLILVIFLCGIITLLGLLNVQMFQQLQQKEEELAMSFSITETAPPETAAPETVPPETILPDAAMEEYASSIDLYTSPQGVDNQPMAGGLPLQEIYARNIDSVVSILCTDSGGTSTGTGVIFDEKGYIITNAHVVEGAHTINVQLTDSRTLSAEVMGSDEISDLAVLRVEGSDLQAAQFGDSSVLRVGDSVVAIGDPLGVKFRGTCTDGIVSAINRDVDVDGHTMTLIQTNAALNAGNSGGPLINCYGQVIGINTMKISDLASSAGVEGLGFAIPSVTVKDIAEQLISQGYVSGRPTLGITGERLQVFYQRYYDLPPGLYITEVDPAGDAWRKNIQEGDILISIDGKRITTMDDLKALLMNYEVGQTVEAVVYRAGQQYQLTLTLTENKK